MQFSTYQNYDISQFINIKQIAQYSMYEDESSNDINNLNIIIAIYIECKILFFLHKIYIITFIFYFSADIRVINEVWSIIFTMNNNFYNFDALKVMIRVEVSDNKDIVQFSDMLFIVTDVLQNCIFLKMNIANHSFEDVNFWNIHFHVTKQSQRAQNEFLKRALQTRE